MRVFFERMQFLALLIALGVSLSLCTAVSAQDCGSGLASTDVAGNCRTKPASMGALEASGTVTTPPVTPPAPTPAPTPAPKPKPKPSTSTVITVLPSWTADVSPNGRGDWESHCAGVNTGIVCRYVASFPTAKLPKDKFITALRLRIPVTYVTTGLSTATWAIGLYGVVGNNPQTDNNPLAFVRAAAAAPYVKQAACCRTVATKDVILSGTAALADLKNAIAVNAPFVIVIRMNGDTTTKAQNKFTASGRFDTPGAPAMMVTFRN